MPTKVPIVKAMVFPVVMYGMWELDHKEGRAPKNWCFQTVVLQKTLESPLDCKEIRSTLNIHWKDRCWSWNFSTVATDGKTQLIGKDLDARKDWRQEEKGMTEDKMVGWHHQLNGHEFEWTPGIGDEQEGLVWCNSWVAKSRTWLSNWTETCLLMLKMAEHLIHYCFQNINFFHLNHQGFF